MRISNSISFKKTWVLTTLCTHRHNSESCVNYTSSNGGIDRLRNFSFLKDTGGVVEHLKSRQSQR